MPRIINEIGHRYGRLLVLDKQPYRANRRTFWQCKCDCGGIRAIDSHALRRGDTISCGCYRKECTSERSRNRITSTATRKKLSNAHTIDERGNKYGKLTVVRRSPARLGTHVCWRCLCKCGNYVTADGTSLRRGLIKSCGCTGSKRA